MQRVDGRMNLGHGTRIVDGEFETIDFDSLSHTTNRTISDRSHYATMCKSRLTIVLVR